MIQLQQVCCLHLQVLALAQYTDALIHTCRLDLGSFCTTFMDKEAEEVIAATQAINLVDSGKL